MMQLVSDPIVIKFIPGMIQDREVLLSWINSLGKTDHEYIIQIEETGEEIGECSLTANGESAEIGFMLLPKYWMQGYGTETVYSLIDAAKDRRLKELTATTDARNKGAIRLLQKCGFAQQKSGWLVLRKMRIKWVTDKTLSNFIVPSDNPALCNLRQSV